MHILFASIYLKERQQFWIKKSYFIENLSSARSSFNWILSFFLSPSLCLQVNPEIIVLTRILNIFEIIIIIIVILIIITVLITGPSTMRLDFVSPSPHLQQINQVMNMIFLDCEFDQVIIIMCTGSLSTSEFPVFTMYAEKICLESACNKPWSFETVIMLKEGRWY